MRNLTFKAAMLNDSRTTVNRQSTDGQSQRHYKQTPLSKRWKVLMTLVFLFTFAIGNVWGDNVAKISFKNADMASTYSATKISALPATVGDVNVSMNGIAGFDKQYVSSSSAKDSCVKIDQTATAEYNTKYLQFSSTKVITKVELYAAIPGSTSASNEAIVGWSGEPSDTPDTVVVVSIPGKGTSNLTTINFPSAKGIKYVRCYRQVKIKEGKFDSKGTAYGSTTTWAIAYAQVTTYVAATAPTITAPTTNQSASYTIGNEIAALSITATGTPTPTYQWYYNSSASTTGATSLGSSAQSASYTPANDVASDLYYYCVATNSAGSATSKYFRVTVSAPSTPTHGISYTNLKGSDVSAYPTTYYEGTGIASFAALADVADFHFTGWDPASISDTEDQDVEVEAQWVAAYNVTFSYGAGGGTAPASFQKWEGAKFNLPGQGSMTAPSGKVFDGWKAGGTKYAENAEYTMGNAEVEFVAQWKNVPTTIFHWRSNISSNPSLDQVISATGGSLTTRSYKTSSKGSFQTQSVSSYVTGTPDDMKANSGKSGIKCNNNDVYLKLALSSGKLKSGDTIWICGYGTIKMYKSITLGSGYNDQITSLTMSGTGTNTFGVNTTACVIPQVENEDVEYDSLCLTRNSNGYLAAIKIVRPAEKEVKSTVNTLTDVKVNGTSIAAANLTTLVSTHSLALDDAEATAPKITFNKHTVITYVDDTQKVTDTPIEETAADNGAGKWAASTTIDAVTYTVTLNIATGYHVTYKANGGDGTMTDANLYAAGDEVTVLDNAFTAPAANKKFNGWTSSPAVTISGEGKFEMPASDVELSAVWTEFFTITYKDGDETLDTEDVFVGGTPAGLSPAPTKPLYVFAGWVNDVDEDVDITTIATTTTVYAQWNRVYVPQGTNYVFENTATLGTAPNAITVTKDNNPNAIAANSRIDNMWLSAMSVKLEDGTYSGSGDDFKGWKINTSGATIRFFVENDSRVTVTVGNLSSGLNITYTGKSATEAATTALTAKQANSFDIKGGTLVTLTTAGGSTVTLKGIAVSEIPAVSDDATLKDLKVGGVTITGFATGTKSYYVEMPYGTAKADLPLVTVTTNEEHAVATVQDAKDRPDDTRATIHVVAQDGTTNDYYYVYFTIAPKYGVELIKATHNGTENGATVTGYIGGTVDKLTQTNGKLGSGAQSGTDPHHYFGIQLAEGTFKAGDMLVIKASALNGGNAATLYSDKGNTEIKIDGQFDTNSKMYVYTLEADVEKIYLYRQTSGCNPNVEYMAVYRLMAPFIEEFKIGEAVGTINKSAKTIAVEVPYGTAVNALTPEIEYYGNGGGEITPTTAQDFSSTVDYTVSSAYAEDATGDYAPVTYTVTVTVADHYEAKIGDVGYATLVEAVAAAVDGDVIVLQENVTAGAGVMIAKADAKQITIDFGGFTYKAVSPGVGSVGTQNQAFHFEKGCDITLKNGTITSEGNAILMLVQNYGDLTLENITLDGSGLEGSHRYVMSNNCGDVVIGDGATITAKTGDVAFDVCATNYYPEGVTVTVKDGATISGIVEYDVWGTKPADNKAELAIEGGTLNITWNVESALAEDAKANLNVSGGVFNAAVPEDYCAPDYAPTSWMVGTETKYGVHLAGVIRGEAVNEAFDTDNIPMYTLDNGVKIYSSGSNGQVSTSSNFSTGSDVEVCGGDAGKYAFTSQHMILKFPKNVSGFKIFGTGSTQRSINKVYSNATAGTAVQIKNVGVEHTGTFTGDKEQTAGKWCQYVEAVFDANNTIAKDEYVYVNLNGSMYAYRVIFTEAPCIDPVINSIDATRMKVGEQATVSVDASAVGATYQWYRCSNAAGDNAAIITGATAASYSFTKAAGDEYFKVVVGCNCNDVKVEAVVKAEEWYEVIRTNVTGYTEWNWNGIADTDNGPTINDSQKGLVLASYIDAPNFDKLEGVNSARVYRSNQYPAYQGTQLKFTTEVPGMLIIDASYQDNGNTFSVNGYPMGTLPKNHAKDTIAVKAGDVTITSQGIRIWAMTFDPDFSNYALTDNKATGYDRPVTEGRYGTICLPNGGVMVGAELYEVAYYDGTVEKIFLDEVLNGEMVAGRPYIFLTKEGVDQIAVFYTDAANAPEGDYHGLFGSYSKIHLTANDHIYILKDNRYYFVDTDNVYCGENRAYFKMGVAGGISGSYVVPAPGRRRMSIGAGAPKLPTGIENTGFESEAPRKVLINGELYIIRGEEMYDAKGQLVK